MVILNLLCLSFPNKISIHEFWTKSIKLMFSLFSTTREEKQMKLYPCFQLNMNLNTLTVRSFRIFNFVNVQLWANANFSNISSERRKKTRKWNLQCSKTKMELKSKCTRIEKKYKCNKPRKFKLVWNAARNYVFINFRKIFV